MSTGVANDLLRLWAADKADGHPPFADHHDMTDVIDAIEVGDTPWTSFNISYSGYVPEDDAPGWMFEDYIISHRDPRMVVHSLLANPEFQERFAYAPYRTFELEERQWTNFMSGNWSWRQALRFRFPSHVNAVLTTYLGYHFYCSDHPRAQCQW